MCGSSPKSVRVCVHVILSDKEKETPASLVVLTFIHKKKTQIKHMMCRFFFFYNSNGNYDNYLGLYRVSSLSDATSLNHSTTHNIDTASVLHKDLKTDKSCKQTELFTFARKKKKKWKSNIF